MRIIPLCGSPRLSTLRQATRLFLWLWYKGLVMSAKIPLDRSRIAAFCQRWKMAELALFGSVLRKDFRPDSDVDVLVTFSPDVRWGLLDLVKMENELKSPKTGRVSAIMVKEGQAVDAGTKLLAVE